MLGKAVGDKDAADILPGWLRQGAPIGVLEHIEVADVFPRVVPDDPASNPYSLYSELAGWSNYSSAEEEPKVVDDLLKAQSDKGHCRFFDDMDSLLR